MVKAFLLAALLLISPVISVFANEVNVYSARKEYLIKPVLDIFTEQTGVKVKLITDKAPKLLARLQQEGKLSPADVLVTVDAGNLHMAKQAGVFQTLTGDDVNVVPMHLRDKDNQWVALTKRARVIFAHKDRVSEAEQPQTYMDLTDKKWKGKIAIRSSSNVYNQSLIASRIAHDEKDAEKLVKGIVQNMAQKPQGGDRDQLRAVAAGVADIAVGNTYYYGAMLNSKKEADRDVANQIRIIFPDQHGRGTHVNISGAGIVKTAPNKENAQKLIDFMLSPVAQQTFAQLNYEAPVRPGVPANLTVQSWGNYKEDSLALNKLGELNRKAVELMNKAGWQ